MLQLFVILGQLGVRFTGECAMLPLGDTIPCTLNVGIAFGRHLAILGGPVRGEAFVDRCPDQSQFYHLRVGNDVRNTSTHKKKRIENDSYAQFP